jgi:hypothetical protein
MQLILFMLALLSHWLLLLIIGESRIYLLSGGQRQSILFLSLLIEGVLLQLILDSFLIHLGANAFAWALLPRLFRMG